MSEKENRGIYEEEGMFAGMKIGMKAKETYNHGGFGLFPNHNKFDVSITVFDDAKENMQVFSYYCNTRFVKPKLEDILECLLDDYYTYVNARDIGDFAEELGYEINQRTRKIYELCRKNKEKMDELFGEEGVEILNSFMSEELDR